MKTQGPVVLLVLDGWGVRQDADANAIALARKPTYDELCARFARTTLEASGERVGLPPGQMGNSEVGHMNMGAGRVVYQDLTRIDKAIADGELASIPELDATIERCVSGAHALHLIGLLSDGGVHSHQRHLEALIALAARRRVPRVFVHAFTDGRDTSPTGAVRYVAALQEHCSREGVGRLASLVGRYHAMDRDHRWERIARAYNLMTLGEGTATTDAISALQDSYSRNVTDEFLEPLVVVGPDNTPVGIIRDGDSVLNFNFRADRVRQITRALTLPDFDGFARKATPAVRYLCMTTYDSTFGLPVVFTPQTFHRHLGEVLADNGVGNLRLAETEKYAHVTYFFNCGEERPYKGEDRVLIPSPKVATYDLQPEMSAPAIASALASDLEAGFHKVVICNFANADMVGHTGNLNATIRAVETLDRCLGLIIPKVLSAGGAAIITADHGNCEQMWDAALACPHTAHTRNPVPLLLIQDDGHSGPLREGGALCDVAPTILQLLGLGQPSEMTGRSLLSD